MVNNKLVDIQKIIFKQIERIDNDNIIEEKGQDEFARAKALATATKSYLDVVNTQLAIMNTSAKVEETFDDLVDIMGIKNETQS